MFRRPSTSTETTRWPMGLVSHLVAPGGTEVKNSPPLIGPHQRLGHPPSRSDGGVSRFGVSAGAIPTCDGSGSGVSPDCSGAVDRSSHSSTHSAVVSLNSLDLSSPLRIASDTDSGFRSHWAYCSTTSWTVRYTTSFPSSWTASCVMSIIPSIVLSICHMLRCYYHPVNPHV